LEKARKARAAAGLLTEAGKAFRRAGGGVYAGRIALRALRLELHRGPLPHAVVLRRRGRRVRARVHLDDRRDGEGSTEVLWLISCPWQGLRDARPGSRLRASPDTSRPCRPG